MASFKLCISDPATGKTFQKEIKDDLARPFIGLNLGETVKGDSFEVPGFEFQITGGSDYCGFPMRRGILGTRKKMTILGGTGFRGAGKGIKRSKTVCGHKIHDKISQINLKVTKSGAKKLAEIFGQENKEEKAGAKEEAKEPKEEKKEKKESKEAKEPKEEKKEKKESKEAKEPKEEKAGDKKQQ